MQLPLISTARFLSFIGIFGSLILAVCARADSRRASLPAPGSAVWLPESFDAARYNGPSRSDRRGGPNPAQGEWSTTGSKIWVNDGEIAPPLWKQPGEVLSPSEISFADEGCFYREASSVALKQGWNKILVNISPREKAWKWMFTCLPVQAAFNGTCEVEDSRFALRPQPEFSDVFIAGKDRFNSIRIPSVVLTGKGTVLAIAEGRAQHADQANNKLILKRSTDCGKIWGGLRIIADDGDNCLNNPCSVVDQNTGRVIVMYQSYPAGFSERDGKIKPGLDGPAIVRNYVVSSDDDGVTWSKPQDVTRTTKTLSA